MFAASEQSYVSMSLVRCVCSIQQHFNKYCSNGQIDNIDLFAVEWWFLLSEHGLGDDNWRTFDSLRFRCEMYVCGVFACSRQISHQTYLNGKPALLSWLGQKSWKLFSSRQPSHFCIRRFSGNKHSRWKSLSVSLQYSILSRRSFPYSNIIIHHEVHHKAALLATHAVSGCIGHCTIWNVTGRPDVDI